MDAVNWIRDPLSGHSIRGHQYVTATIRFRGYTIPFGIRLYIKKEDCPSLKRKFKKTTQLAAELIGEFEPPEGVCVRVLFDSYYLCPVVVKACRKKGERRILGLVTDDPKLSARQMIRTYDNRWSIEVFFKDSKQLLGLGQYQNVSYEAAVTHLHLVCFAYALLTYVAITREGAQGKQKSTARLSTADLQNEVRRMVWDEVSEHLKQFSSGTQIIKELEQLLIAA